MVEAGFKIGERAYPVPSGFRWVDTVLVERLTGLKFSEYGERYDAMQEAMEAEKELPAEDRQPADPIIVLGLVAVSIWQANKTWTRERVEKFVSTLEIDAVEEIAGEEAGEDPPAAGEEKASPTSSETVNPSPVPELDETTLPSPGVLGSDAGTA